MKVLNDASCLWVRAIGHHAALVLVAVRALLIKDKVVRCYSSPRSLLQHWRGVALKAMSSRPIILNHCLFRSVVLGQVLVARLWVGAGAAGANRAPYPREGAIVIGGE